MVAEQTAHLMIGGVSPRMWVIFLHDDGAVNGPHPRDEVLLRAWERQGRLLARG